MIKLNRKGQTLVEYVLIIVLITVVAIGAVKIFGGYLQDEINKVGCNIYGKKYIEKNKGKRCKKRTRDEIRKVYRKNFKNVPKRDKSKWMYWKYFRVI